jgi:hypothetical protein
MKGGTDEADVHDRRSAESREYLRRDLTRPWTALKAWVGWSSLVD